MATTEEEAQSVEEIAANNGMPLEDDGTAQLVIPGTGPKLGLTAGGERPTTSEVVLRGGSIGVSGQFDKGETVSLWVEAKVAEVHFVDKHDREGYVETTKRKHVLRIIGVERSEE